jgi:ferredoxin
MNLVINEELCIGCGVCADVVPDLIEMNEDQIAVLLTDTAEEELATEAVESCPVDAIVAEKK